MSMTIAGATELRTKFNRMREEIRREVLEEAAMEGAEVIADEARLLAPVLTEHDPRRIPGLLRASIITKLRPKRKADVAYVEIGPRKQGGLNPFYAAWVEFGTRFAPAQPYTRPALLNKGAEAGRVVLARLWATVQRYTA